MWIENISKKECAEGKHHDCGENSMLIQIVDPATFFPEPKHQFKEVHQFEFLDLDTTDPLWDQLDEFAVTDEQAQRLVELLQRALDKRMNVVVHCHAGLCRSGAVAEIGIMMGFIDSGNPRMPNLLVKHKMMKVLGWTYDEDETYKLTVEGQIRETY